MKKNTLFKVIAIMFLVFAVLSWIIPASQASGSEIMNIGLSRVSLHKLIDYPYLTTLYFSQTLVFILLVGGFYGVLGTTGKYRNCLEKIAKSMKGKESLFLIITAAVLAILNSVFSLNILLLIFIPALCGIILLMGYDKITAFLVTFISPLLGVMGSTYGSYITGYANKVFGTEYNTEIIARCALLVIGFVVFIAFTLKHAKKSQIKEAVVEENAFLGEKKQSKKSSWPLYTIFGLLLVLVILGYTDWENVFNVTVFSDFHTTITEWQVGDHTILAYLIDGLKQFGSWEVENYSVLMLISILLINLIYNIKLEDSLKAFVEGIKNAVKPALLVMFGYVLLFIAAFHPYLVTIAKFLTDTCGMGLAKLINVSWIGDIINVIFGGLNTILTSIMNVDYYYTISSTGPYMASLYSESNNVLQVLSPAFYGLTMFVAPTSTMMILGLEFLNIPYLEWLKKSWKLVLELLLVVFLVLLVVLFI